MKDLSWRFFFEAYFGTKQTNKQWFHHDKSWKYWNPSTGYRRISIYGRFHVKEKRKEQYDPLFPFWSEWERTKKEISINCRFASMASGHCVEYPDWFIPLPNELIKQCNCSPGSHRLMLAYRNRSRAQFHRYMQTALYFVLAIPFFTSLALFGPPAPDIVIAV